MNVSTIIQVTTAVILCENFLSFAVEVPEFWPRRFFLSSLRDPMNFFGKTTTQNFGDDLNKTFARVLDLVSFNKRITRHQTNTPEKSSSKF